MQTELTKPTVLLNPDGRLAQVGWSRQPLLDCNLENTNFYTLKFLQRYRIKRWDYYAVFSPRRFFSATIADLGYAGNLFVYSMDFTNGELHEEGVVVPLGKGVLLPRNSQEGESRFDNGRLKLIFTVEKEARHISVDWPEFHGGRGINADIELKFLPEYESMNITIPICKDRFYFNRKINCLPASGVVRYGQVVDTLNPKDCLGSLDWGRGVWEYKSFWNWASASGFLPDGRSIGLNLGCGFGDLSKAGENAVILGNRVQKLGQVPFEYDCNDYMKPWKFKDAEGRLDVVFTPIKERIATTNLAVITSEVHQMFGRYNGWCISDSGEKIHIKDLIGFAEEHHASW